MSLLSIKHVFGIETKLLNCIFYLNEHCYIYPSIRHIILYDVDYKSQILIPYENEYDKLESLIISPNKQYLAIGLNILDKNRILIYEINQTTIKQRKILCLKQKISCKHILSMSFSSNSKLLAVL